MRKNVVNRVGFVIFPNFNQKVLKSTIIGQNRASLGSKKVISIFRSKFLSYEKFPFGKNDYFANADISTFTEFSCDP